MPEVTHIHLDLKGNILSSAKEYIANPKAVAAQTYKSKKTSVIYYESKIWEKLSYVFSPQIACETPEVEAPDLVVPWVALPWAINNYIPVEKVTAIWFSHEEGRQYVRHIRLFRDYISAKKENSLLSDIFYSASSE